ncbi:hypothetical protein [Chitinophaga rhizosphaerae]|uniref:hypothetical protein n=1 Tax=Chitinophaga rhizosphaerae TaxID=1864947 RepID=UPI000F8004DB|nr:hypothetical protein [Chitinophaga rhizosphaerae]
MFRGEKLGDVIACGQQGLPGGPEGCGAGRVIGGQAYPAGFPGWRVCDDDVDSGHWELVWYNLMIPAVENMKPIGRLSGFDQAKIFEYAGWQKKFDELFIVLVHGDH